MKEILNTLYEIEDNARQIMDHAEIDKKELMDKYTQDFDAYKAEIDMNYTEKLNQYKQELDASLKTELQALKEKQQLEIQVLEAQIQSKKVQIVKHLVSYVLSANETI